MLVPLWIATVVLAVFFLATALLKIVGSYEKLSERMRWVRSFSPAQVKAIGVFEALGAIGLVLPQATGILPWLTVLAAFALMLMQIGAVVVHAQHKEFGWIPLNLLLIAATGSVAVLWFFA